MWGSLDWITDFINAIADAVRGWFSDIDVSGDVSNDFDTAQSSFAAWVQNIFNINLSDFFSWLGN